MRKLLVGDVLWNAAGRMPHRVAATMDDRSVTFADLATTTAGLCRALPARGITHGSRVVWRGETSLDAIALAMAVATLGGVLVPINPRLSADESDAVLGVADPHLVVDGDALDALLHQPPSTGIDRPEVGETDPHVIFFTSGSTGRPKGVELSHRATLLRSLLDATPIPAGPALIMFPQFHMAGWQGPTTSWLCNDEAVYVPRADAEPLLAAIDRRRVVRLYAIPAVWRRLLDADRSGYDLSCLRTADTGTSATTPELLRAIGEAFPTASTSIYYGSTEAGSVCRLPPPDIHRKPGSVGPAALGVEVRLEHGELVARSPWMMNGYFRDPEATAAAVVDGWYHTGDLAEQDADGYYSIVGRAKDIIRTGGETVAPAEIDVVLLTHPAIVDAAVAGVPDPDWGEVVTAFAVLRPGASLDLAGLRAFCEGRLAPFKHPRRLVLVDEIPRTGATRQVQRRLLAAPPG